MKFKEIYKDIEDYEGYYKISNYGNVYSVRSNKILKQNKNKKGYALIGLCVNRKVKNLLVSRLVAKTFIPNPNNFEQVNHKDENKDNNCFNNLEWCTNEYNANYGTRSERSRLKRSKRIFQYDLNGNLIMIWPSAREIERSLKVTSRNSIKRSCINFSIYKDFKWSFNQRC